VRRYEPEEEPDFDTSLKEKADAAGRAIELLIARAQEDLMGVLPRADRGGSA